MQEFNSGLKKVDCPPLENGKIYRSGVPVEEELTPSQLVNRVDKELGRKLGAVVDLTFTSRYYTSKVLEYSSMYNTWYAVRAPVQTKYHLQIK